MKEHDDILRALYQVILERKGTPSESSYTASLMAKGILTGPVSFKDEPAFLSANPGLLHRLSSKGHNPADHNQNGICVEVSNCCKTCDEDSWTENKSQPP